MRNAIRRRLGDFISPATAIIKVERDRAYPLAGVYSFGRGLIDRGLLRGDDTKYHTLHRIMAGSIVFSKLGAWEGGIALVPDEFDGYHLSVEFPVLNVDKSLCDLAYLRHLAAWHGLWDQMAPRGSMIRRKRTTPATFMEAQVPLPPIAEQRRIAGTLDDLLNALARSERVRALEAATWSALLRSSFSLDAERRRLGDVLTLTREAVDIDPTRTYRQIGIRSFGKGMFFRDPVQCDGLSKLDYFHVYPGHIVFSNIMAWEGAVAITGPDAGGAVGSQRFLSYKVSSGAVDLAYVNYFFQSEQGMSLLRSGSTGTVKRNQTLSPRTIEAFQMPLPPIAEQRRVASTLERFAGFTTLADRARDIARALRKSALNAAFSGEL